MDAKRKAHRILSKAAGFKEDPDQSTSKEGQRRYKRMADREYTRTMDALRDRSTQGGRSAEPRGRFAVDRFGKASDVSKKATLGEKIASTIAHNSKPAGTKSIYAMMGGLLGAGASKLAGPVGFLSDATVANEGEDAEVKRMNDEFARERKERRAHGRNERARSQAQGQSPTGFGSEAQKLKPGLWGRALQELAKRGGRRKMGGL